MRDLTILVFNVRQGARRPSLCSELRFPAAMEMKAALECQRLFGGQRSLTLCFTLGNLRLLPRWLRAPSHIKVPWQKQNRVDSMFPTLKPKLCFLDLLV